ncbi:MAG: helix-turn-helix transcriptional regulator [Coriobacteriales bacterium]|jgi:AraC-like DNA-binding protein|nr:helix-turn-helix transcriptional regulator [Coriobacteriales bacterium]
MYKDDDSLAFELLPHRNEKSSFMWVYKVIPGLYAAFHQYNSSNCYVFNDMAIARDIIGDSPNPRTILEVNICREGMLRVLFPKRKSFSTLLPNDVSLALTSVSDWARAPIANPDACWNLELPSNRYRGFGLIIDIALVESHSKDLLEPLGIKLSSLIDSYCQNEMLFIMSIDLGIEKAVDTIELHKRNAAIPLLRLGVLELLARIDARAVPKKSLSRPECAFEILRLTSEAKNHAVNHLFTRYTIGDISRKFGMCPTMFKTAFKELYGEPYARFMTRTRMEQASTMLADGELVFSVAEAMGYESPSKFAAAFKRVFGEAPSAYRDRMSMNRNESQACNS